MTESGRDLFCVKGFTQKGCNFTGNELQWPVLQQVIFDLCLFRSNRRFVFNATEDFDRFTIINLVANTSIIFPVDLAMRAADDFYFACHLTPVGVSLVVGKHLLRTASFSICFSRFCGSKANVSLPL